jgi:hypothetical protein
LAHNQASGSGGGLDAGAGSFTLRNTIVAENRALGGSPECHGRFTSRGYNLIGDAAGCTVGEQKGNDLIGRDPRLATLDVGGGSTMHHAPRLGSPAVDGGACDLAVDQIGVERPVDGNLDGRARCDIGAVELTPVQLMLPLIASR